MSLGEVIDFQASRITKRKCISGQSLARINKQCRRDMSLSLTGGDGGRDRDLGYGWRNRGEETETKGEMNSSTAKD